MAVNWMIPSNLDAQVCTSSHCRTPARTFWQNGLLNSRPALDAKLLHHKKTSPNPPWWWCSSCCYRSNLKNWTSSWDHVQGHWTHFAKPATTKLKNVQVIPSLCSHKPARYQLLAKSLCHHPKLYREFLHTSILGTIFSECIWHPPRKLV